MYITPINAQSSANKKINFGNGAEITKKILENTPRTVKKTISGAITKAPEKINEITDVNNLLKRYGITHISNGLLEVNIATGQYGFFSFRTLYHVHDNKLKDYVAMLLESPAGHRDLPTYIKCVNDLKRQDIIMRGAGIQSYEMNLLVNEEKRHEMLECYSKYFKNPDFDEELFFANNRAFYYDSPSKTMYTIHTDIAPQCVSEQHVTRCRFVTDEKGNSIGYDKREWDLYAHAFKEIKYREQSEPSQKLPNIVDINNNKLFAESFRFGNAQKSIVTTSGIQKTLEHLRNKAKISDIDESKLQYVKFSDRDNNTYERISYFNPVSGRSIVYNNRGEFLYQLEYIKDHEGALKACNKL